jgi:hypothetical protein
MSTSAKVLDFYARFGVMTSGGKYERQLAALPDDMRELMHIVQGLLIHEYAAAEYGVQLSDARKRESHIRSVEQMLDRLLAIDPHPLSTSRPPAKRLVGVCDHFVRLLVTILRAKGVPTRDRFGFGTYFNPGFFEDHAVCEYWNAAQARWILVDPQFDEVWLRMLKIEHDVLDVPRDRFLVAGEAWRQCREGSSDAARFGIFKGDRRGMWFVAGSLVRDLAALNKMELLPWDVWGAMPEPDQPLGDEQLALFDRLAALTRDPDQSFDELRRTYERDERVRAPKAVFNAILQRAEAI